MSVSNHDVKILLCGFYFQGNTGDDLLMESIVETLSRHGEVKVTSTEAFDVELLNWCQLLVIGAGSLITPRGIGGYEHAKYAKENGKKVVYYSQTIEEGHPQFREHLARADLITVRDSESKKVVEANGFRAVFASDPIFKMKKRSIGFSFRRWVNEPPDIVEKLASMLDNLAVDYEIFSLPYTENNTDTESDASFHEQVIRHMKNKPKQAAYDDAIQRVDLFMGMRLHALINGVNMGKRVLAINYDTKVGRIFSDLAKNDGVVSYDDLEKIPYLVRNEIFRIDKLALREKVNEALVAKMCSDIRGEPGVKVSIIMPTYNRANYLKEAIDSILTQTIQDWELIIVDGGSTDNTKELVESYREERIRYYNFGNNGISYSRNIGNLLSRGEIIAVADSDDINLPNRLEVTCKQMKESKADIVYSSMFHFDDTGEKELIPSHPFSYERLKEGNFIYHPTIAYRRDVAMACPYNEDLEMVEDYHFYLQAAEKGYKFHQVEEPLAMHRLHKGQISSVRNEEMAEIHRRLVESEDKKIKKEVEGQKPLVSVIVPTYNRPGMLKEALMSILSQTYQNFEVMVVNDAGEDVKDVIDALNKEGKIIYLQHQENKGLPAARNTGLKAAKGKYIAYLDDDDIYYPNHLETLVNFLEKSAYKVAYTDSYHVFQEWITDRYVTVGKKIIYSHDFDRQRLLVYNYIPVLNVIHRKDLIEVAGLYDVTLGAHEDWDMWIRLSQYGDFHHIIKATTEVSVRTDKTTMTSRTRIPFLKTMEIIHNRYSHLVTNPSIFEEQKKAEEGLARQVEIEGKDSSIPIYEYIHRYRFAREFVRGKKVLNLACGEGDGSFLLSEEADSVIGIDIKDSAIRHASSNHIRENLTFINGSITDVPIEEEKIFDTVVYFEAMENIQKYDKLMMEVKRLLKPDGIFIVSISNKYLYSDVDDYGTPIHAKRLHLDDIKKLLSDHFKNILLYGQKVYPTSNIFPLYKEAGYSQDFIIEKGDEKFLFKPLENRLASTFIAVASDHIIDKKVVLGNSHLLDISETLFRQKDKSISLLEGMVREKDIHISNLEGIVTERGSEIESLRTALIEKERELSQRDSKVSELTGVLCHLESKVRDREATLNHIYNSQGWKALRIYYSMRDRILPVNTKRRLFGKIFFRILLEPVKVFKKLDKTILKKFFYYFKVAEPAVLEEKIELKISEVRGLNESPQIENQIGKQSGPFFERSECIISNDFETVKTPVERPDVAASMGEIRVIAFFLPQFHPIPENDRWWGKGFTEWNQVVKALPNFVGHYQPHLPADLGFYDLRVPEVREQQAELAREHGIHGFCYFHYWFSGHRLLEKPFNEVLKSGRPNFPFCLCWANENWTRRWDGLEHEILIAQVYSEEDDIGFIRDVIPVFSDDRYIRINGKPLLIVYRVNLLPNPKRTAEIWRQECEKAGVGDIYLCAAQSFGITDPKPYGFDAAVEFPPHGLVCPEIKDRVQIINPRFNGKIFNYGDAVSFTKKRKPPKYKLFRTVMPSWDNTARRQNDSHIFANTTIESFKEWFYHMTRYTQQNLPVGEKLIFINAWNEWGEGNHIEPDLKNGKAYLEAIKHVLSEFNIQELTNKTKSKFIIFEQTGQHKKLLFRKEEHVLVSIIIPVHNKWEHTYQCLLSIFENSGNIPYEIILADDGSTDETIDVLRYVDNIRVVRNQENLGFLKNINNAAKHALGKYIVFLNNDTLVQNDWLTYLIGLIHKDDRIGLIGPKLIFPNGRLQEAGGIIWKDGTGCNYGRLDDPKKPEYNYVKEVDYISGACIMIRKDLWEKVGGFDERFSPAYYEDSDLAFQIRGFGYKVVYQPKSVVVHFEGVSHGTDLNSGIKRHQVINQRKFIEKWKDVLDQDHIANSQDIFHARDNSKHKKTIVVIDHCVPDYDKHAGSLTTYQYIRLLQEMGFKVIFIPDSLLPLEPYTMELQQLGIEVVYGQFEFKNWVEKNGRFIQYFWLARPNIAVKYIKAIKHYSKAKIVYYTHDLHYLRELRRYEVQKKREILEESDRLKKIEFYLFENVDTVLTPSGYEKTIIKGTFANKQVVAVPAYYYDLDSAEEFSANFESREGLIFLGGFAFHPNVDAVNWFIDEIYPAIKREVPEIKFYIVGSNPPPEITALSGRDIIVTGYLRDLGPMFQKRRVFICPLRYGAGVKGKIVMSMYYGVPVVTTGVGNEGLSLEHGAEGFVADDPIEFARWTVELYTNPKIWARLSENSMRVFKSNFSKSRAKRVIFEALGISELK